MLDELQAPNKMNTWDLVDLHASKSAMDCKWIYKIKTHSDRTTDRYKARQVAMGFTQEQGIDYEETFAPARFTSICSLLTISAIRWWYLFKMDIKNVFLHTNLTEDVYIKLHPSYSHPLSKACKLHLRS